MIPSRRLWPTFPNKRTKLLAWIYLFNLCIPALFLALLPPVKIYIGIVLLAAFAVVYLFTFYSTRRAGVLGICVEVLLMMLMIGILNVGYIWMIFYPAAAIGVHFAERRKVIIALVSLVLICAAEVAIISLRIPLGLSDYGMVGAAMIGSAAATFGSMWQTQTYRSHQELSKANAQIERLTKAGERDRISQDLHDVMGHELSMITLKAQLVQRLIDRDPAKAKTEARDIETAARKALTRVREYIADIRQARLDEEWEDAIKLLRAGGITCTPEYDCPNSENSQPSPTAQALSMCLREAATNIVRHSKATEVYMKCWSDGHTIHLFITDNGVGLPSISRSSAQPDDESGRYQGNGLNGIRARVSAVDGTVYIWSNGTPTTKFAPPMPPFAPWMRGTALHLTAPIETVSTKVSHA